MKTRTVKTNDGFNEERECYPVGVRGLSAIQMKPGEWNVSHDSSGMAVLMNFPTMRDAELAAKELKGLADWTLGSSALAKDKKLGKAVRRLRNEFNNPE